ncbi:MAG: hypothetical protein ACREMO_00480 [Gemmatimonadales bacterium]
MRWRAAAALALSACAGAAVDHERLGDAAYGRETYAEALAEYRAAVRISSNARAQAKLGLAALHTQNLREAAEAYQRLAAADETRLGEAASGLELVARAADRSGDGVALREAITALRKIAPNRVAGRYALGLFRGGKLSAPEALVILPAALAAATDAGTADSLLVNYGAAFEETAACGEAIGVYRAARRRSHIPELQARARAGLAECGLRLGEEALRLSQPAVAARWFGEAIVVDSTSDVGRRSLLGMGDARMAQGDILAAAIAFESAIVRDSVADSISQVAARKLNALGSAQPGGDSTNPKAP